MKMGNYRKLIFQTLIIALMLLIFSQISFAIGIHRRGIDNYSWSFQAAVHNDLNDDNIEGAFFAVKKHYMKDMAFRFAVAIDNPSRDYFDSDNFLYEDWLILIGNDYGYPADEKIDINVTAQYLYYPSFNRNLNLYWGAGPIVSVRHSAANSSIKYFDDYYDYRVTERFSDKYTSVGLGAAGSIGLEWFLTRQFSLMAEYELTIQHEWMKIESNYTIIDYEIYSESVIYEEEGNFTTSEVKLGFSVYF